ncbi:G-type lectin S-receptor-like serine/threonine-protein kinase LECRK3 [Lactuca sativa]|uniref:G-type lectin S-receptor-like serine/threonine-protein kinase LECRK3 n=1 Tax=Lactuca sativa TaxID=4236 RepID=UPI000CB3AF90|nr:G-type lectin S-receptor-like serine/threonine-protein kinase LECRK3 [Lactuca sativa]
MALVLLRLVFLTIFLLRFIAAQQNGGSVSVGASLTATPNVKPWLSSSGEFAFGFQQVQGTDNFLLSIWYEKIPDKTIVWYPEEGQMVPTGSKVELLRESGLVLTDPLGTQVWRSGSISGVASGFMNDTGNFVMFGSNSRKLWGSFDYPADTLLPTMFMESGEGINSTISKTNFSGGQFQLRFQEDGNLVLNTRNILSGNAYDAYYTSDTHDATNSTNSGEQVIFDATGYMYILRRNGQRFDLTPRGSLPSGDYYQRATLDSDGVFRQYYFPKNPTSNTTWKVIWFVPDNICVDLSDRSSTGACGFNNVCSFDGNRPNCECPQGFSLVDPNNPSGDCKADFTPTCDEVDSNNGRGMFDFIELQNIDWPFSDYMHMNPSNENTCKSSCLEDCFCAVAIYRDTQCWKKKLPLSNGRKVASANVRAFVKHRIGDGPVQNPPLQSPPLQYLFRTRISIIN